MKTLNSPNESVSKEQLLTLQEATTKIKQIIASDVLGGVPKNVTEGKIKAILKQYRENSKLSPTQTKTLEDSLIRFAQAQHYTLTNNMKVINARAISSMAIDPSVLVGGKVPTSMITEDKFRGYVTNGAKGLPTIKDYQKQVRNQLKVLASQPPKVVSYTNKNGTKVSYTMSARNRAEMAVRYEANMEDLAKFKEDGTNLVWTSSHADCSKRCQKWQGKLFSLNGTKGSIDGIPYEPIENALNDNGGNSIINGYNCRHYLIEYRKGMKAPANYNSAEIKKQRAIDTKQRYYENQIRKEKQEEAVLRAAGMTKEADKLNSRWHILNERYEAFSKQNNRAFYTWRTQVMRDEPKYDN